jgi:hypothetical protein
MSKSLDIALNWKAMTGQPMADEIIEDLQRLEQIENVDGGEALKMLEKLYSDRIPTEPETIKTVNIELCLEEEAEIYNTIKQSLTPPTEQEVCEALGEHFGKEVTYSKKTSGFYLGKKRITSYFPHNKYLIRCYLPPHLITLIGQFYE